MQPVAGRDAGDADGAADEGGAALVPAQVAASVFQVDMGVRQIRFKAQGTGIALHLPLGYDLGEI